MNCDKYQFIAWEKVENVGAERERNEKVFIEKFFAFIVGWHDASVLSIQYWNHSRQMLKSFQKYFFSLPPRHRRRRLLPLAFHSFQFFYALFCLIYHLIWWKFLFYDFNLLFVAQSACDKKQKRWNQMDFFFIGGTMEWENYFHIKTITNDFKIDSLHYCMAALLFQMVNCR